MRSRSFPRTRESSRCVAAAENSPLRFRGDERAARLDRKRAFHQQRPNELQIRRRFAAAHAPGTLVPGAHPGAAALLGGLGLRHPAALRHGGGRRHLSPGDDLARARAEAVERRLCAAVAPAEGRPLRREPEPPAALLSVPGDPEAVAATICRSSICNRSTRSASTRRSTTSASSRTTGRARRSAPGGSAGSAGATAWRCRSSPISSRSPASNARRSPAS